MVVVRAVIFMAIVRKDSINGHTYAPHRHAQYRLNLVYPHLTNFRDQLPNSSLNCFFTCFSGTNPDGVSHWVSEDLTIADITGSGSLNDGINYFIHNII